MARLGIDRRDILGIVHNHPAAEYSDYPDIQRYPSGGKVPGGDWNAADWFVSGGAGGSGGDDFSLFVIDTAGKMREFRYSDRDKFKNLDFEERNRGKALPPEVESDGTAC
jgi:hypothetical protein